MISFVIGSRHIPLDMRTGKG